MKYLVVVVGEREKETGPGSVQLGVGHEYEIRTHHIEAVGDSGDTAARLEAHRIVRGYLNCLRNWKWTKIQRVELYRFIDADSWI